MRSSDTQGAMSEEPAPLRRFVRVVPAVILILVTGAVVGVAWTFQIHRPRPQLHVDDSVHADFEALALDTWDQFVEAFEARIDCFGGVTLKAAYDLDSRAAYDPETSTVAVRVPGTPAMLQGALVHEWAHHLEFQCEEHKALRPAFTQSLGMPAETPWRPSTAAVDTTASVWAGIPSEQWAEAAIVLVLGSRQIPTKAHVTSEALHILHEWAKGTSPQPSTGEQ